MNEHKKTISVLIVDDHRLMRDGLKSYLQQCDEFSDIYETGSGLEAIHMVENSQPDVILMDVNLPDINGMEATRQIIENAPGTKVLALTMHTDKEYVMGMMKAGALGFLTKTCSANELCHAVKKVYSNKVYICEDVLEIVLETAVNSPGEQNSCFPELTKRESQVLKLIADGNTNAEISKILCISPRTVEKHRNNLMNKLGMKTVAQLTKYAIKSGLSFIE